ncbi:hypothetical protein CGZ75_08365 [Paenibacillus herberti]|uniref:Uncharacterized protein n=1 Tax=Paenibacillus herberti TaxID=1619309 RepID=A0A229P3G2_9BACL|nr:hypothetical protein CGZ75_08365 [Paenibacillus herberti]
MNKYTNNSKKLDALGSRLFAVLFLSDLEALPNKNGDLSAYSHPILDSFQVNAREKAKMKKAFHNTGQALYLYINILFEHIRH